MDLINWVQTGGLPVKGERLQEMQTAYSTFNELGYLAGNFTIISGCLVSGTNVGDGYVFINGEVLKFKGGFISESVIIIQNESAKEFENGEVKAMHFERYATFGTAENSWLWSEFKRPFETKSIPPDLIAQLEAIGGKEDKTTVDLLIERIKALEERTIPQIKITTGSETVTADAVGYKQDDYTKNYVYVYPPTGYTMSHLAGFMPSINQIAFAGDVNSDDTLWCKYRLESNRVTVICSNSETRFASKVNYIAIWIK